MKRAIFINHADFQLQLLVWHHDWLTDWLTDRLLTKLRPKLKLCNDVTTVIGRRTGEKCLGRGERGRRRKRRRLHCQDFRRNSVVELHRVSVPHYENVRRHSLDNVYTNLEAVKPNSPPLPTHPCNHPTNGAIKIYIHSLRSYNWLIYSTNSRTFPPLRNLGFITV